MRVVGHAGWSQIMRGWDLAPGELRGVSHGVESEAGGGWRRLRRVVVKSELRCSVPAATMMDGR
jgi:hypothetical protein